MHYKPGLLDERKSECFRAPFFSNRRDLNIEIKKNNTFRSIFKQLELLRKYTNLSFTLQFLVIVTRIFHFQIECYSYLFYGAQVSNHINQKTFDLISALNVKQQQIPCCISKHHGKLQNNVRKFFLKKVDNNCFFLHSLFAFL